MNTVAPAQAKGPRIETLDVLRGFAVCGMFVVNISMMGQSAWDIFLGPEPNWSVAEVIVYWVKELYFEGTSRAMFSILFGASFMIMMSKVMNATDPVGPVDIYYRRCLWMMVIGICHATILLWPGDILFHYAMPAMALLPFRHASPKILFTLAAVLMIPLNLIEGADDIKNAEVYDAARPALTRQLAGQQLDEKDKAAIERYNEAKESKGESKDDYPEELAARQAYWSSLKFQTGVWLKWLDFEAFGWALEAFTFMLIGIGLFKLGVLTGAHSTRFYLVLGLVGLALGLAINIHETWLKWRSNDAAGLWLDEMTYQHGRLAMALATIGLLTVIVKSATAHWFTLPLQSIGRMALSNYLGQSILAAIVFTGFGYFGKLNNVEILGVVVIIWAIQIIASTWWLRHFLIGPAEWVWRSLTYWKLQPLYRHGDAESPSTAG